MRAFALLRRSPGEHRTFVVRLCDCEGLRVEGDPVCGLEQVLLRNSVVSGH